MSRYLEWHRRVGTAGADPFVVDLAQNLLGYVVLFAKQNGLNSYKLQREYNGYIVEASYKGGIPKIEITPPPILVPPPVLPKEGEIWIPRGFVVYPANLSSLYGWGMPVIQSTGSGLTHYSPVNLAPGLDVSRWTEGGPLGQVLLTAVPKAGYPESDSQIAPLMFTVDNGPKPTAREDHQRVDVYEDSFSLVQNDGVSAGALGYRMEFVDFTDKAHTTQVSVRRTIFDLTNAHRVGVGLDPLSLPIRGYYSAAQIYADMEADTGTFGHYASTFWPTFKTPADRLAKDGMPHDQSGEIGGGSDGMTVEDPDNRDFMKLLAENNIVYGIITPTGVDPNGDTIATATDVGGGVDPTAAFNAWLASPGHRANIENVQFNQGAGFLDVGTKQGFATQDFTGRDQWIQTGNAAWHSQAPEVPAISWMSFHSMNLAFETWPVAVNGSTPGPGGIAFVPSTPPVTSLTLGHAYWMTYGYKPVSSTDATAQGLWTRPALTSSLFMRGRLIGIVPHAGYVLGACVQKLPAPLLSTQTQMYRIVALVHVEADQVGSLITTGATPILHIYTVDLPDVEQFAAHSDSVIKGVRGSPVSTYPWQVADDPWAWVDAGTVDVSSSGVDANDLLTYFSLWRFNSDGSRAICLRQQITVAAIDAQVADTELLGLHTLFGVTEFFQGVVRAVQLNVPLTGGAAIPSVTMLAASAPQTLGGGPPVHNFWDKRIRPLAVDYGPGDAIECVYYAIDFSGSAGTNPYINDAIFGKGPLGVTDITGLSQLITIDQTVDTNTYLSPCVLDVVDFVLILSSMTAATLTTCWQYTNADVLKVDTYRQATLIDTRWFPNPDGNFFESGSISDTYYDCTGTGSGFTQYFVPIYSMSRFIQGSYAKNCAGDWVLGYQMCPQPLDGQTIAHTTGMAIQGADSVAYPSCIPSWGDYFDHHTVGAHCAWSSHNLTFPEIASRGGWCTSSFANNGQLATLTGTPGSGVFFSRVGVV